MFYHVKVKKSMGTVGRTDYTFENDVAGKNKFSAKDVDRELEKGVDIYVNEKKPVVRKSIVSTNATTKSRAVKNPEITKA